MAKDRMEMLKIIEGLNADQVAREAEMRQLDSIYLMNITQFMLS